jgi:hypothetical protein
MDIMDIPDLTFVDIDELGVRPPNTIDDGNEIDFNDNFGKEKLTDLQLMNNGKTDFGDTSMDDEDDSNYEIDPETGEKIFHEGLAASSPSLSSSTNDKWIEEYLSNIESLTTNNQLIPTTELLFEDIPLNTNQTDSNWFSKYIPVDESTTNNMFPDQVLSEENQFFQTTSPILIPLANKNNQNSYMNMISVSTDDEHSISSNSNSSRTQRLYSSFECDSVTRDSEFTFDGHFIEAKLEKLEHDEHTIPHMFMRRTSTRTNYQGQQDEETLRRYNIPLTLYDITQSSTEEYNHHLTRLNHLNPEQIHVIKDIRRRGKNKIAAQNCRKRKAHGVESLLDEVDELKRIKHELEERKKSYQQQIVETRNQYEYLHRQVLPNRQLPPAIIVK